MVVRASGTGAAGAPVDGAAGRSAAVIPGGRPAATAGGVAPGGVGGGEDTAAGAAGDGAATAVIFADAGTAAGSPGGTGFGTRLATAAGAGAAEVAAEGAARGAPADPSSRPRNTAPPSTSKPAPTSDMGTDSGILACAIGSLAWIGATSPLPHSEHTKGEPSGTVTLRPDRATSQVVVWVQIPGVSAISASLCSHLQITARFHRKNL